ncbi:hypothetical protein [Marinobacter sp. C2H3]|uniref:hypothetical protein n=1 Tax=Marinobacter sp. C2H3 TaxID=3119003 RepID=UPI00300F5AEB
MPQSSTPRLSEFRRLGFLLVLILTAALVVMQLVTFWQQDHWTIASRMGGPSVFGFVMLLVFLFWLVRAGYYTVKHHGSHRTAFALGVCYLVFGVLVAFDEAFFTLPVLGSMLIAFICFSYAFLDAGEIKRLVRELGRPVK